MSQNLNSAVAVIGIDIGKNSFHVVGLDDRGAIVLHQKWSLAFFTAQASATVESAEPTYYHDGVARLLLPMWGDGHVAMLLGITVPL